MLSGLPYRTRPLLLVLLISLCASGLFSGFLFNRHQQLDLAQHNRNYGQALANLAARQAVDATLNHDLVSLQVILTDVAQNPNILGATIHDVENRLLVQGGHHPVGIDKHSDQRLSYSAPITLHDSVAGYVTVTLAEHGGGNAALYTQQAGGLLLLALLATFTLILWQQGGDSAFTNQPTRQGDRDQKPLPPVQADGEETQQHKPKCDSSHIQISLEIHNLDTLRAQLNREAFRLLLERFEQQLQGVLSLYRGHSQQLSGNRLLLKYSGQDQNEAIFRALCSAQLLLTLAAKTAGAQLRLSASVAPDIADKLSNNQPGKGGIAAQLSAPGAADTHHHQPRQVYIAYPLLSEELDKQVEYTPLGHGQGALLAQIKPPYQELLVKQEQQLLAL